MYTVSSCAQCLSVLFPSDIQTLKRTIWYIKGTLTLGIKYQKSPQEDILHGYSDADWEGHKNTQRSTSGYCFILVGKEKQATALSST